MTGTIPFPNESDEEIVEKVAAGIRPWQPSDDLSYGISYELWGLIVACWYQEPNERPTALETLRGLDEAQRRESAGSVENSQVETMIREWGLSEDDPEESTLSGWL